MRVLHGNQSRVKASRLRQGMYFVCIVISYHKLTVHIGAEVK